ncbi:hypothetical protein [Salarchaeum sp. JOR-1]|uniref:hypothetical protein n=1 Tax=Salarchaeum sp. JOR-1 TaxID=2599399 RepID=UPI0011984C94|nr:hypothetical protein [Salarchaeum sp. JOR-1]QDX41158.1 hypothetical protein FQU85_09685 [Salarchaeum sp. JOR-1]
MSRNRIDKKTLEEQLPVILREQLRHDGLPRDHLPAWEYITANTRYSAEGLNNKCQEIYGQTLHEFLRDQGFGARSNGKWPTDDDQTVQSLEYYIQSLENNLGFADSTIDSVKTTINRVYEAIHNEDLDIEILEIGHYESEEERTTNIQSAKIIIQYLDEQSADGTMQNYTKYFSGYYRIVKNQYRININPVEEALDEFQFRRSRGDPSPVTEAQIRDLWHTLDALEECPVRGYDLKQWRLWMKVLLIFMMAVGPRSNEIERIDVTEQLEFGDDPYVHFVERKNLRLDEGPQKIPIMMGASFLEAYVDYIEAIGGNGKLVPSPQSDSGCRTPSTLNNWIEELSKEAGVRVDDGSFPTIQNFRQLWKNLYKEALQENREQIKFVSEEAGTKTPEVDEKNYLSAKRNRRHIRELGRQYFDDILEIGDLPDLVSEVVDQDEYISRQTTISKYDSEA